MWQERCGRRVAEPVTLSPLSSRLSPSLPRPRSAAPPRPVLAGLCCWAGSSGAQPPPRVQRCCGCTLPPPLPPPQGACKGSWSASASSEVGWWLDAGPEVAVGLLGGHGWENQESFVSSGAPVGKQLKKFPCTGEGGWWYEAGGMCISSGKEEFSPPILPSGVLWHLAEEDPPPPSLGLAGVG